MRPIVLLDDNVQDICQHVAGRAVSRSRLGSARILAPDSIHVLTDVHDGHVEETGLRERALLEGNTKVGPGATSRLYGCDRQHSPDKATRQKCHTLDKTAYC
jgi:hypothetical protein